MGWLKEPWPGGRIWVDAQGRKTYVIRRSVMGKRYEVSTRAGTIRGALAQLEKFDRDPAGFSVDDGQDAVHLTQGMIDGFMEWSENSRKNSSEWRRRQKAYLAFWKDKLDGVDLRRVKLAQHVVPALAGSTARAHRIAVLKGLYSYLRRELHALTAGEDPTLDLKSEQSDPAQWTRPKIIAPTDEEKVIGAMEEYGDVARLVAALGCHLTEVWRFAKDGEVTPRKGTDRVRGFSVLLPQHKSGAPLRLAVSDEVAEVAKRVLAAGPFSESRVRKAVRAAKKKTGVKQFSLGWLRHTLAHRAVEAGEDVAAVAAYLGHRSPRTTRRFYATMSVIPRVKVS
jgi:integrase